MAHVLVIEGWISDSGNLILSILKKMGHSYTFVTRNPGLYKTPDGSQHPLFKGCVDWIETDTNDIPNLIERVKEIKFDGVITACDYYFEAVSRVAEAYDLPCPLPRKLDQVRQKHLMRQAVEDARLANATFRMAYSWNDLIKSAMEIGYPLIIKPVDLGSSAFVRLIENESDLKIAYEALKNFDTNYRGQKRNPVFLIEEYMTGEEVSVECVVFKGEVKVIGITDKSLTQAPHFVETGHMFPAKVPPQVEDDLTGYVKSVLKAVGFENGVAHTEVKLTASGPKVVEINPRVPGNYIVELIDHVTGINLLDVFVGLSLGLDPRIEHKETGVKSAASLFILPSREGTVLEIKGLDKLKINQHLKRYQVLACNSRRVEAPKDNACYLGHVIAEDRVGYKAREYGEIAIEQISLIYDK